MSEKVRQVRPKGQLLLSSHDLAEWAKPKQPLCMSPSDTPAASANDGIPTIVKHHKIFLFATCSKKRNVECGGLPLGSTSFGMTKTQPRTVT